MTPTEKGRKWCEHIKWSYKLKCWYHDGILRTFVSEQRQKCDFCGAPRPKGER